MEDLCNSPWATESATFTPRGIDLLSEPQQIHFSSSTRKSSRCLSPWGGAGEGEEDDAWGGWNDAVLGRKDNLGLGTGLDLGAGDDTMKLPLPDPWKFIDDMSYSGMHGNADLSFGISMGEQQPLPTNIVMNGIGDDASGHDGGSQEGHGPRSESSDVDEAERELDANKRHGDGRHPSEVQQMVVVCDNTAECTSRLDPPLAKASSGETRMKLGDDGVATNGARHAEVAGEDDAPHDDEDEISQTKSTADGSTTVHKTTSTKVSRSRPLLYPIDLSPLDDIFPGTQPISIHAEALPDTITDTFSSPTQREAWHRVSRFGSFRKHSHGDDETYVSVSWHRSHIRKQVLATTRRWMEEDSCGGRLLQGCRQGGRSGAGMFNWDSDAPDVRIGELLARKGAKGDRPLQTWAAVQGTMVSSVDASGGWSASASSLRDGTRVSSEWRAKSSHSALNGDARLHPGERQMGGVAAAAAAAAADDDDDEWGDMVSPVVDNGAVFRDHAGLGTHLPSSRIDKSLADASAMSRGFAPAPVSASISMESKYSTPFTHTTSVRAAHAALSNMATGNESLSSEGAPVRLSTAAEAVEPLSGLPSLGTASTISRVEEKKLGGLVVDLHAAASAGSACASTFRGDSLSGVSSTGDTSSPPRFPSEWDDFLRPSAAEPVGSKQQTALKEVDDIVSGLPDLSYMLR